MPATEPRSSPAPTTEGEPTGNPVFDFRADFRRSALRAQAFLMKSGLILLLAGGAGAVLARTTDRLRWGLLIAAISGLAMVAASLAWGFWWRRALRAQFQREFRL